MFVDDKDEQCTFDSWYSRYDDLIEKEGNELDDASKDRIVLLKMDAQKYALFTNIILPKKPADLKLVEVRNQSKTSATALSIFCTLSSPTWPRPSLCEGSAFAALRTENIRKNEEVTEEKSQADTCDISIRTIDDEMIRATSSKNFVII
uniref:DUF7083 domain-containing protein n=1 Tax=Caenorhabditis japonica TaxID=281687 RepID=A0A8R1IG84_CAEJA